MGSRKSLSLEEGLVGLGGGVEPGVGSGGSISGKGVARRMRWDKTKDKRVGGI